MLTTTELESLGYKMPLYIKTKTDLIDKEMNITCLYEFIFEKYVVDKLNCVEIHELILQSTTVKKPISIRHIQRYIKNCGVTRSRSEIFKDSIKKGRKDYSYMIKPDIKHPVLQHS
jgi:hypothetical protein